MTGSPYIDLTPRPSLREAEGDEATQASFQPSGAIWVASPAARTRNDGGAVGAYHDAFAGGKFQ
jgi:hypothetical protein